MSTSSCAFSCVWCDSFICCNILQHTAPHSQHTASHCNILQHTATHCNTLQHAATHCNTGESGCRRAAACSAVCGVTHSYAATYCNTLHHTATHCNTLQHTPTHLNTLEHTATQASQDVDEQLRAQLWALSEDAVAPFM